MKVYEFGSVVLEKMMFKGLFYFKHWWTFCSAEQNYLYYLERGYCFLDQWFRRRCHIRGSIGSNFDNVFSSFFYLVSRSKYHLFRAIMGPSAKRHLNGFSLAGR